MKDRSLLVRTVAVILSCLLATSELATAAVQPELPDPGTVGGVSKDQQVQIGLKAMGEVYQQMPVLPDSHPVAQYIQQLGRKLTAVIPPQHSWPYQFHVVQQKEINAFALPGGPIFINVGTIQAADNEAELVGVMAHEMSHVYMQHSIKAAKKESVPGALAGLLGGILGAYGGTLGSLASLGIKIGAGAVFMKYSREDEAQADAVGAIIMYKAGYNPQAMADFFKKLEKEGGAGGPQFLSDHPNPGNREAAIQKEIRSWPPKNWLQDSPQFVQAKNAAQGVKVYTAQEIAAGAKQGLWAQQNAQHGATPANLPVSSAENAAGGLTPQRVSVSSNFTELQHTGYTISYPDNWKVYGDPQSPVTIAPQGGVSQNAVAYGVLINQYQPQSPNASLDQALNELVASLKQQNPDIKVAGNPQDINVNGVRGKAVDLIGTSPIQQNGKPEREHDWLVAVPQADGSLLYLVFVSPESDFSRLRPTFEKMLRSLRLQQA
jgi:predicted Zn-dependent protease